MWTKTIITCLAATLILGQAQAQEQQFQIQVTNTNKLPVAAKVFVRYMVGNQLHLDSLALGKGVNSYTGTLQEPTLVSLFYASEGGSFFGGARRGKLDKLNFYVEAGDTKVNFGDSIATAKVQGGAMQVAYAHYDEFMQPFTEKQELLKLQRTALYEEKEAKATELQALGEEFTRLEQAIDNAKEQYIRANPASYFSLLALQELAGYAVDVARIEPIYQALATELQAMPQGQALAHNLATAKRLAIGQQAPDFVQPDKDGKLVKLSDFRGQYLLLDFWASWCGPCRAENPNLVKAYQRYKDKNFTILAVSLDRPGKKQDWLNAIEKDGLPWVHVSDLLGWKNEASSLYGIQAIPQNVLIDPQGKIVAKNLHGAELETILKKLL